MENDSPKIDFSTILIIIAIIIVGYLLYKNPTVQKWNEERKSQDSSFSQSDKELELLTISSTISEDCEILLSEFLYLLGIYESSPKELLIELNLLTNADFQKLYNSNLIKISGENYIKTHIDYETFKEKLLNYVSENVINSQFSRFKNYDGFIAVAENGSTDAMYEINGMELISYNNNSYTFDVDYNSQPSNDNELLTVTFLDKNGTYIISNLEF